MTGAEEKMQGEVGTMSRAAPVDDLFAPMGRLDVQSLGVGLGSERGEGGNASLFSSCAISSNVRSRTAEKSPTSGEYVHRSSTLNPSRNIIILKMQQEHRKPHLNDRMCFSGIFVSDFRT